MSLLQRVERSIQAKMRNGWSMQAGAGFLAEDIVRARSLGGNKVEIVMKWGWTFRDSLSELNLPETIELAKFLRYRRR